MSHTLNKPPACVRVDTLGGERERKATAHVQSGVHIQTFLGRAVEDGVDLDEQSWPFRQWPRRILMPLLPAGEPSEPITLQGSLHGGEGHRDAFEGEAVVENLRALPTLRAQCENPVHGRFFEGGGVMVRAARLRGNEPPSSRGVLLCPAAHRARFHTEMAGNLAHAPAAICDEPHRISPYLRLPRICGIWHVHILG